MGDLISPRFDGNARLAAAQRNDAIQVGERDRAAVRLLQEALLDLGFSIPSSTTPVQLAGLPRSEDLLVPNGIFGEDTGKAVAEFQSNFGLVRRDGLVGEETMSKLHVLFLGLNKLIRRFKRTDSERGGARVGPAPNGFSIGGRFDVTALFVKDPKNLFKRLEYRQFIKGQTLVNGRPANIIRLFRGGVDLRGRPLGTSFQEDGQRLIGPYGHRDGNISNAVNDAYLRINPEAMTFATDRPGGDLYRNFDYWGLHLDSLDRHRFAGRSVVFNLQFEGRIVEVGPDRSERLVEAIRWPETASGVVPPP
jgi:Putative peptidoglycan binding domain